MSARRAGTSGPFEDGTVTVYHSTDANFEVFDPKKLGSAHGTAPINRAGFSFTDNPEVAKTFGKNLKGADITINRPYLLDAKGENYSTFKDKLNDVLETVDRKRYDGIVIKNYEDAGIHGEPQVSTHYIPLTEQINSSPPNPKKPRVEIDDENEYTFKHLENLPKHLIITGDSVVVDGKVVGGIEYGGGGDGPNDIFYLEILPKYRNKGYAARIVELLIDDSHDKCVQGISTPSARAFWKRLGATIDDEDNFILTEEQFTSAASQTPIGQSTDSPPQANLL